MKKLFNLLILSCLTHFLAAQTKPDSFEACQFYYTTFNTLELVNSNPEVYIGALKKKQKQLKLYSTVSRFQHGKAEASEMDVVMEIDPESLRLHHINEQLFDSLHNTAPDLMIIGRLDFGQTVKALCIEKGELTGQMRCPCPFGDAILMVREGKIVGYAELCFDCDLGIIKKPGGKEELMRAESFFLLSELMYESIERFLQSPDTGK